MSDLTITTAGVAQTAEAGFDNKKGAVIRVTPTIATAAYAAGDVLFVPTEIPKAVNQRGGLSRLIGGYVLSEDSQTPYIQLIFTQKNTAFGTINDTADLAFDSVVASNVIGAMETSNAAYISVLDNCQVAQMEGLGGSSEQPPTLLLRAESDSTSVYVQGIVTTGTPDFSNTDGIQLVLHIEYL